MKLEIDAEGVLVKGCDEEHVEIPEGVVEIAAKAFWGMRSLKSVKLPESLKRIGDDAFRNTSLGAIDFPEGLEYVGYNAFLETANTETVQMGKVYNLTGAAPSKLVLPEGTTCITSNKYVDHRIFFRVEEVVVPASVREIAPWTFAGVNSLEKVVFEEGTERIGEYAFDGCTNLKEVYLPDSLRVLEGYAFSGCRGLQKFRAAPNVRKWIYPFGYKGCGKMFEKLDGVWYFDTVCLGFIRDSKQQFADERNVVVIREGTTAIVNSAFTASKLLEEVTIPDTVTSIGISAFDGCKKLTAIHGGNGVRDLNAWAFRNTRFPEFPFGSLETMDIGAFDHSSLISARLPSSLKELGGYAFADCKKLMSVTIEEGVTEISENCFNGAKLSSIVLPSSVKQIKQGAFWGSGLKEIYISKGCKEIGRVAFHDCDKLKKVAYEGTQSDWAQIDMEDETRTALAPLLVCLGK